MHSLFLSVNPYIRLLRPINCVMGALAVILVGIIVKGYGIVNYPFPTLFGVLTVFFALGGGNVLNDYFDREIDLINHPERPIPAKKISPHSALFYGISLFIFGLIFAIFINPLALMIAVIAEAMMLLYEIYLKRMGFAGNVTISFLVGLLFIFGGALYGNIPLTSIFALMAFSSNLGREIVKDIEDMEGDINRVTLPKKMGRKWAAVAALFFFLLAISLSPLPYYLLNFGIFYLFVVLVSDAIFIYAAIMQFKNPSKGQRYAKLAMIVGLIAYLVGGLT